MKHKILIDPHPFLDSVQNWLQDRYDVEFLYLGFYMGFLPGLLKIIQQ
jgi:hypothetical protein